MEPFESIMQSLSKEQEDMMLNMEGDTSSDDDKPAVPLRVARFSMVKSSSSKSSLSKLFILLFFCVCLGVFLSCLHTNSFHVST